MTYAQTGLIEAGDYNTLVGSNTSVTGTNINSVWAWGANSRGYGQTAISQVSASSLITATQWASLINTQNSANTHINGSATNLTANTSGQLITFVPSLQGAINGINTDRLKFASNSAAIANHNSLTAYPIWAFASTSATVNRSFGANVAFNSPDQARFFFNAGGRLKFNITATTAKSILDNIGGLSLFGSNINGNITGTGATWASGTGTTTGYYNLTIANTNVAVKTSTTSNYTTDKAWLSVRTNGTSGQSNDNGTIVSFWTTISSTSGGNAGGSFDDGLGLTPTVTVDVSYPEVTNISNTWGAVTVTRL